MIFTGGEPTLKPGFDQMLMGALKLGLRFGIITNGLVFPDELIDLLRVCRPFGIGVSLDGTAEHHNHIRNHRSSWLASLATITRLKESGISVVALTTITKVNWRDLRFLAGLLIDLGVDRWQIQLAVPMGRMDGKRNELLSHQQFSEFCRIIADLRRDCQEKIDILGADCFGFDDLGLVKSDTWHGCSAGLHTLGIKANGDVLPCLSLYHDRFICGNLRQNSLKEIWENDERFDFNRHFDIGAISQDSHCYGCSKLSDCRGGCSSMSFGYYGRLHSAPFCIYRDVSRPKSKKGEKDAA